MSDTTKSVDDELRRVLSQLSEDSMWCLPDVRGAPRVDRAKQTVHIDEAAIKTLIANQVREAYRKGYNDNARDCICDSVDYRGFTERVPHRHLMDDGESHNIQPDIAELKGDDK